MNTNKTSNRMSNLIIDTQSIIDNLIQSRKNRYEKERKRREEEQKWKEQERIRIRKRLQELKQREERERKHREEEGIKRREELKRKTEELKRKTEELKQKEEELKKKNKELKENLGYFTDHVMTGKLCELLNVPSGTVKTKEEIYKLFNNYLENLLSIYNTKRRHYNPITRVSPYYLGCSKLAKFLRLDNHLTYEFSPKKVKEQIGKSIIDKYIIEKKIYDEMKPWERPGSWEKGYGRTKPRKHILPNELINDISYFHYNQKLIDFSRENNISLPKVSSSIGKIIAYMSNLPEDHCITKEQVENVVTHCEINIKNKKRYITNEKIEKYKIKAGLSYIPDYYYIEYPYKLIE
jgi:hypothetical protein